MAADNQLIIEILTKYMGREDAQQAAKDLQDLSGATEESGQSAMHSMESHRALHMALNKLNEIVPGLGTVTNLAAMGFRGMAGAELTAAEATDVLISSMGPLAILLLSIQAAIEYWHLYEKAAKDAAAAQAEAWKGIEASTKKALDAQLAFNAAISGQDVSPTKKYTEELEKRKAVLQVQAEAQNKVLEVQKKGELAGAKTPEQKKEIETRYADLQERYKAFQDQQKQTAIADVADEIDADLQVRKQVADGIHQQLVEAEKNKDDTTVKSLTEELNNQTTAVKALNTELDTLRGQGATASAVAGAQAQAAARVKVAEVLSPDSGTISSGVSAVVASEHGKIDAAQLQAINDLRESYQIIFGNTDHLVEALKYAHRHGYNQQQEIVLIKQQLAYLTTGSR